jgi:ABC-type polysaccharide/polyol phosphate transport system ATPase subunit
MSPPPASRPSRCAPLASEAVIELRGVTKRFPLHEGRAGSLRQLFVRSLGRRHPSATRQRFSLSDITLRIRAGESWALLGRNGAGKSTLLRLVAGIHWPTEGTVVTRGRVAALIELSAGFHPELSGQENVHLYGAMLGLTRAEIARRYDEIVEFAAIGDVLDLPVKYYSSGMRMRLGFAVATAVEPDVILLDEILAVGDAAFRERCLERLRRFEASGCTRVLATHDLGAAEELASRAAWLEEGRLRMQGEAKRVVEAYRASFEEAGRPAEEFPSGSGELGSCTGGTD